MKANRKFCARANDEAVSPVVGTILMVAVTAALAATVLAVLNGFGSDSPVAATSATFTAKAFDTNGNDKTDVIRVTYISGPATTNANDVVVSIANAGGVTMTTSSTGTWSPGDFRVYDVTSPASSAGSWFVTVSLLGTTVLDATLTVAE